jgi:hypothetical protein
MLDLYDAGGEQWTELVDLARQARRRGWWRAFGIGDNSYVGYETEAAQVQEFASGFVPGLLQVPAYSEALFLASPLRRSAADVEREVEVRRIRQERLTSAEHGLRLVAILTEAVLRTPVGGPDVLAVQLDHLAVAAELDTVTLQVLPAATGAHAALVRAGEFDPR